MSALSRRRIEFDEFTIDLDAGEIVRAGAPVSVEPQVFNLIALLASAPGRLFGHDEIIEKVWGGRVVSDSAVASRVTAARKALGDNGRAQRVIKTVRGRGFRFELRSGPSPYVLSCTPHGYSILMGTRGPAAQEDWRDSLPRLLREAAGAHGGTVLANHLATFADADAALRAAAALIEAARARCEALPAEQRWKPKVGIADSGESSTAACSRAGLLAAVAAPGGACATVATCGALSPALAATTEPLPDEAWYEPVAAVRVLGVGTQTLAGSDDGRPRTMAHLAIPEPEEVSVAVLPFGVLGGGAELEEIGIGLRLEIQNALAQLSGVLPIAAGSVAAFAGAAPPDAASALGVRYVVSGHVRARRRQVRLMLELYDRSASGVTWSRTYDGSLDDGFEFQDEMTARVVKALDVHVLSGEQARVWHHSFKDLRTIRLQYKGMREFFQMTKESMRTAREAFETVHRLCPDVSAGATWVALCHWFDVQRGWSEDVEASKRAVELWASIAIRMPDADGQAHTALCHVHLMNGRFEEALAVGAQATTIRPSCANANGFYAHALYFCGLSDKAAYHARLAIRFSPAYPPLFGVVLAGALHACGDHVGAIAVAAELVRLGVRDPLMRIVYCSALAAAARFDEAGGIAASMLAEHADLNVPALLETLPFRSNDTPRELAQGFARARRASVADEPRPGSRGRTGVVRRPDSAPVRRKLTAIVLVDIVGYSRLSGVDEFGTHREAMSVLDFVAASVARGGGCVLRHAGDSMLAEFASITDAVTCCIAVQSELRTRSRKALAAGDNPVEIRIGVNLGEVLEDRGEIFGDGVNLAARLEAAAPPGGICVTSAVHDAVSANVEVDFRDCGEMRFKNIARPVRVFQWTPAPVG